MSEVKALKRLLRSVETALNPKGTNSRVALSATLRSLPKIERLERLVAAYLQRAHPSQARGASLAARRLILNALRSEGGLLEIHKGRVCLQAHHRANLSGYLVLHGEPRQAIEQLQRGASCTAEPQSFWDEAYLISTASSLQQQSEALKRRTSETVRAERSEHE